MAMWFENCAESRRSPTHDLVERLNGPIIVRNHRIRGCREVAR